MASIASMLKSWHCNRGMFISPPFRDLRSFKNCKQILTRAWIHADYDEKRKVIRIPFSVTEEPGKSNHEKLEKLDVFK